MYKKPLTLNLANVIAQNASTIVGANPHTCPAYCDLFGMRNMLTYFNPAIAIRLTGSAKKGRCMALTPEKEIHDTSINLSTAHDHDFIFRCF